MVPAQVRPRPRVCNGLTNSRRGFAANSPQQRFADVAYCASENLSVGNRLALPRRTHMTVIGQDTVSARTRGSPEKRFGGNQLSAPESRNQLTDS
jgi:hypothetical protein